MLQACEAELKLRSGLLQLALRAVLLPAVWQQARITLLYGTMPFREIMISCSRSCMPDCPS